MRFQVNFCVDVDADDEREAYSLAKEAVLDCSAGLSYTVEELKEEPHGEARAGTRP